MQTYAVSPVRMNRMQESIRLAAGHLDNDRDKFRQAQKYLQKAEVYRQKAMDVLESGQRAAEGGSQEMLRRYGE